MRYHYELSNTDGVIAISIWDTNEQAIQVYRKSQTTWVALINDKSRPGCKVEKMFRVQNNKAKWNESGDTFVLKPKQDPRCPDVILRHEAIINFISATKAELWNYKKFELSSLFINDELVPNIDIVLFLYWDRWSRAKLMKLSKLYKILNNPVVDTVLTLTQVAIYNYWLTDNINSKNIEAIGSLRQAAITNNIYFRLLDQTSISKSLKEFKSLQDSGLIHEIKDMLNVCYDVWTNRGIVHVEDLRQFFDSDWVPSDKALHGFIQVAMLEFLRYTQKAH